MLPIIIIGTGLAGYQLAREYRKFDAETPLLLITADAGIFYSKPLLSTALTNKKTAEMLATSTPETMAQQLNAVIKTHTHVSAINPYEKTITVNNETLSYQKLVLACGADVIKPPLQGNASAEIFFVNHLHHYAEFLGLIKNKKHITILGAGLIGCEFANDLSNAGYEAHVVAPVPAPLDLLVPEQIGRILREALEQNGVHFHLPAVADSINKNAEKFCVQLSNGEIFETDFVLSAIGLRPHTALAQTAALKINRGVVVNRFLETSIEDIYALGDCAEVEGHVLPFITPLLNCTRALAKTLSGARTAVEYPAMPVIVKTPAHPLVICPPPKNMSGRWEINTENNSVRALFYRENELQGFVLTNEAVKERFNLVKHLPGLF